MAAYCDLHAHTTASDGDLAPAELVSLAVETGLGALGVTDHDTVAGLPEAIEAAERAGLGLAPGVEISAEADCPGHMHILGYFVDHTDGPLLDALEEMRGGRHYRNRKIVKALNGFGFDVTYDEWLAAAGDESVGRPTLARILVDKGYVADTQEAFDKYLGKGCPAYFDRFRLDPEKSVELIRGAGGIPVLAHPYQTKMADGEIAALVEHLTSLGLGGIEAYYSTYTPEQTAIYLELAERHGLLVTGGSDFHGSSKPHIKLGSGTGDLQIPMEIYEQLKAAAIS